MLGGVTTTIKVAHIRLCHSRMFLVRAYPRETQEMVFAAHDHAFRLFGGACRRGIYDNMTTAVDAVFLGKERRFNRRFFADVLALPGRSGGVHAGGGLGERAGREPGRQYPRALVYAAAALCRLYRAQRLAGGALHSPRARESAHPERDRQDRLGSLRGRTAQPDLVSSVPSTASTKSKSRCRRAAWCASTITATASRPRRRGDTAQLRAYADRIVVWCDGEIVGEHARRFGRGQTAYGPWHYLPVLAKKPGARCATATRSATGICRQPLAQIRRRLAGHDDSDRQFVDILTAVAEAGLDAVEERPAARRAVGPAVRPRRRAQHPGATARHRSRPDR